eukprot:7698708-Pyramimonas_sp.AAC.1
MSHIRTDRFSRQVRDSMLWSSGLVPRSCFPSLPPRDCTGRWHTQYGDPQGITGNVYTDGACQRMWYWPEATRAGWGFCKLSAPPPG